MFQDVCFFNFYFILVLLLVLLFLLCIIGKPWRGSRLLNTFSNLLYTPICIFALLTDQTHVQEISFFYREFHMLLLLLTVPM